jgi:glucose-6-phosphate 1-dehydrogenase
LKAQSTKLASPCNCFIFSWLQTFLFLKVYGLQEENWDQSALSIVVVGASGDLAKKKIFPALFALYYEKMLPQNFRIYGYARSKMCDDAFRDLIAGSLTCRLNDASDCGKKMDEFLARCFYQPGQYASEDDFKALDARLAESEASLPRADRLFYLSIPPNIFTVVAASASISCSSKCAGMLPLSCSNEDSSLSLHAAGVAGHA